MWMEFTIAKFPNRNLMLVYGCDEQTDEVESMPCSCNCRGGNSLALAALAGEEGALWAG